MPLVAYEADFFALRTALLPFREFGSWGEALEAPTCRGDQAALQAAIDRDRARLRATLVELTQQAATREALFVASPSLEARLPRWSRNPDSKKGRGVEHVLVRYFGRMAGRSTPFGLFAGSSVGTVAEDSNLVLEPRASYERHTRLDMDYLCTLVGVLCADSALRGEMTYRPNSSLYRVGGRLRYAESRMHDRYRTYHLVAVEESEYLERVLDRARSGARLKDLVEHLVDPDITEDEASAFVHELIDSEVVVPELEPAVTGREAISGIIETLTELPSGRHVAEQLASVERMLAQMDQEGLGREPSRYREIARRLEALPAEAALPRLFQVDMVKPARDLRLGREVVNELRRGVAILTTMFGRSQDDALQDFRRRFEIRYGDRRVPLMHVLDEEIGIGFQVSLGPGADTSPLLEGLTFPDRILASQIEWTRAQALLARKLGEALADRSLEMSLSDDEVEQLGTADSLPLPDALHVMGTVVAASKESMAAGDFRVVLGHAAGPPGARLLGRFCHADEALHERVREHVRAEEALHPEVLYAEVVHLPQGRVGNILSRPVLREAEIAYLGRSTAPRQVPIEHLTVGVEGPRVVLRLRSTGQEVQPRLSTAHDFSVGSLGTYRFLCFLQGQGTLGSLSWSWGSLGGVSFLPRVRVGRCILHRARWRLGQKEIGKLAGKDGAALFAAITDLRERRGLPRRVGLVDGDNVLPLDLHNILSLESFVDVMAGRFTCVLEEMLPDPDSLVVQGPEGGFVHEIVVPMVRKREVLPARRIVKVHPTSSVVRRFEPGSTWLYVKLYTGTSTAERILRDVIVPVVERSIQSGSVVRWFFIRYGDPDYHLRVRFCGRPANLLRDVLPHLREMAHPFLESDQLWKIQVDTYEREILRYGGPDGIELSEDVFHVDSDAAVMICALTPGDEGSSLRWRLSLRGMNDTLDAMGFSLEEKHRIVADCATGFGREFNVEKDFKQQIRDRFRHERRSLNEMLAAPADSSPISQVMAARKDRLRSVFATLRSREEENRLTLSREELAPSYLHMHANRMLRSAPREQEMLLHHFLERLYASRIARGLEGV